MESLNSNSQERELHQLKLEARKMHSNDITCFKKLESHLRSLYQNSFVHVENPKQVEMTFLRFFVNAKSCPKKLQTQFQEFFDSEEVTSSAGIASLILQENFKDYMGCKLETYRNANARAKFDMGKALDVGLVVTESNGTESDKQDTSSRSGNGITYVVDADIRPVYDQVPFVERKLRKRHKTKNRNLKPREMPSVRTHHTPNTCTPKPRSNNQTSRNWPASKSSEETLKFVQKAVHFRTPSSFSDSKHFVCSTCQKCVFNANHDACITKFLKEVNSRIKIQFSKTRNSNKPIEPNIHTQKPDRQFVTGHRFSLNKSSAMHEKTNTPRSCLRWIPTDRIFNNVGLRCVPTGKIFTSSTTRLTVNPQMVQMKISLTHMNAIKLLMSVQTTLQAPLLKEKKNVRFSALYL
uniref:Uncharacterized protein n=1 Tax=Tanacetum cinerariifolium TaxID=118510 RepID=A0A699GQC0_TANCI|nr:hypothetical protein [Tanacetum cinerariifolium]